ncbi:MAG: hypothetical protein O2897_03715 [bacterium]|nr:hypothetical protein [bacterium]
MLVSANNMHEYFREALGMALKKSAVQVTENAQAYLVYLLSDFTRSEKVYAGIDPGDKPSLALLLLRAQEAEPDEALRIFKHMGDSALYLLGFFNEAVHSQIVGPSYYIGMGEQAYSSAASLTRVTRDHPLAAGTIYSELSYRFADLVTLLNIISLYGKHQASKEKLTSAQLLELMERYKRTKSPELLDLLTKNGVVVDKFDKITFKRKAKAKLAKH